MEVFEAIYGRRSVRNYAREDLTNDDLGKILDTARWAPSAGNVQPWEIILVKNPETKLKLAEAALSQGFIAHASVVLVVCVDLRRAEWAYGERGRALYCLQDAAAAIQNMLLAVHALGFGACWVGAFREEPVSKILGIPSRFRPIALIPIGHVSGKPSKTPRRKMDEIVHQEHW